MEIGRRLIYDNITGKVILDMGQIKGEDVIERDSINGLDYIDLPFGQDVDKFMIPGVKYHVDPITKIVIFDEIPEPVLTPEQQEIEKLQNELMIAQGVI